MQNNIGLQANSDLLFICEDSNNLGAAGSPGNYICILSDNGKVADFAKNIAGGFENSEFSSSTISEDCKTLFANLQTVSAAFAIWGDCILFKM